MTKKQKSRQIYNQNSYQNSKNIQKSDRPESVQYILYIIVTLLWQAKEDDIASKTVR